MIKTFLLIAAIASGMTHGNIYTSEMTVIQQAGEVCTLIDSTGNVWSIYGDAEPGAEVVCIMDTAGTAEIADDIILNIEGGK